MSRLILAMIIGGGACVFMAVQDMRLRSMADEKPQSISCADLQANGPGDNLHITMQDFLLCEFAYVYEKQAGGNWSNVWVPAVPVGGEFHKLLLSQVDQDGNFVGEIQLPSDVNVIVQAKDVENESELQQLAAQESLQGMVINLISSLGSTEKELLKESYPSVDFDNCYILEVGRTPASAGKLLGFGVGGLALMVAGGATFLARRRTA